MAKVDSMKTSMDFFPNSSMSAALSLTLNDPVTVITWHLWVAKARPSCQYVTMSCEITEKSMTVIVCSTSWQS